MKFDLPIESVLTNLAKSRTDRILNLTEAQLEDEWLFKFDDKRSLEWNVYKFSESLERHKRFCRQWEEHHNGQLCVVERVRDKYLIPKIREFLIELNDWR